MRSVTASERRTIRTYEQSSAVVLVRHRRIPQSKTCPHESGNLKSQI
jgi:hypothetical protein